MEEFNDLQREYLRGLEDAERIIYTEYDKQLIRNQIELTKKVFRLLPMGIMNHNTEIVKVEVKEWYCETCKKYLDPKEVTFEETHDVRCGGCGKSVSVSEVKDE